MRMLAAVVVFGCLSTGLSAAEPPAVETFLHSGELARGELVLAAALEQTPQDDPLRFGLGVLQFVRGVERLGQGLYEYGCRSENNNAAFVRLPVPKNPDPTPITYFAFRRLLDAFYNDLAKAEATLAGVTSEDVSLRLRLSDVRFDVIGDGTATQRLSEVLQKLLQRMPRALVNDPAFEVCFDRGDVPWLRAYCHLLMAMIDMQLALDLRTEFDLTAGEMFANPKHRFTGTTEERDEKLWEAMGVVAVADPARLPRFRRHLLAVCELNRETWKFIRAEQDDDHEWLPNPRQKGVIGLPVTDEMIDVWLGMVDELEAVLTGRKGIPSGAVQFVSPSAKGRLNLQVLLDDPPSTFDWNRLRSEPPDAKYMDRALPDMNLVALFRVMGVFQNSLGVAYAVWFN
jgi:hypothetical protein